MMKRIAAIVLAAVLIFSAAAAESRWVLCKRYVNVRRAPSKQSEVVGRLDAGDEFETDGTIRNGFIRVIGIGEYGEGWVFEGYTCGEQPEKADERYVCVAIRRVACRRWAGGPQLEGKNKWLNNGVNVTVYWRTEEWSLTSRGYIASEWLEVDPE